MEILENEEATVFIEPVTGKATILGNPYHVDCAPGEEGDE